MTKEEALQIVQEAGYTRVENVADEMYENRDRTVGVGEEGLTVHQAPSPQVVSYLEAGSKTLVYRKTNPGELRFYLSKLVILVKPRTDHH